MSETLPSLEEMKDILDVKGMEFLDLHWFALSFAIFVLVIIFAVLLWFFYLRKKRMAKSRKPLTPLEKALRRLEEIKKRELSDGQQVRLFYFGINELFREFLEEELKIPAVEATQEELKRMIKSSSEFSLEEKRDVHWFLELSDMAKFAKFIPAREQIERSLSICESVIQSLAMRNEAPVEEEKMVAQGNS